MTGMSSQGITVSMDGTVIGEVTNFSGLGGSTTVLDATTLASTAKEKIMGLQDSGQFQFDINFVANSTALRAVRSAQTGKTLEAWEVDIGLTTPITFNAYVVEFPIEGGVDALVTGSVTLEISGAIVWPTA